MRASTLVKLREDVNAGWKDIEEGKVSDFDPEEVKRRGRARLERKR